MFEDQTANGGVPPKNLPVQPPDMLAEIDKVSDAGPTPPDALAAGVLKKKDSVPEMSKHFSEPLVPEHTDLNSPPVSYSMKGPILGKIFTFIFIIVLLGVLGVGGWWIYGKINDGSLLGNTKKEVKQQPTTSSLNQGNTIKNSTSTVTSSVSSDINNDTILFGEQLDTDKDNLDDRREKDLGTDPTKPDTDGDGLNDGDEVLIWHTDPLHPDTDGDGYKDGEEVRNGYNPLGSGKLFTTTPSSTPTNTTSSL